MIAANIWHWWIGVVLTGVGVLTAVGLVAGYLKSVTALKHPLGRRQGDSELCLSFLTSLHVARSRRRVPPLIARFQGDLTLWPC